MISRAASVVTLRQSGGRALASSPQRFLSASASREMTSKLLPSASLVLAARIPASEQQKLQPGQCDYKVLLLQRGARGQFGQAHVFPGGNTDAVDYDAFWQQQQQQHASKSNDLLIERVCAIRETFEEAGLFIGTKNDDGASSSSSLLSIPVEWRKRLLEDKDGGHVMIQLCKELNVFPNVDSLIRICSFITPKHMKKRYNTQFFLHVLKGDMPIRSEVTSELVDLSSESSAMGWYEPTAAIAKHHAGQFAMFPPQYYILSALSKVPKLDDLERVFVPNADLEPFEPEMTHIESADETQFVSLLPGDELHSSTDTTGGKHTGRRHRTRLVQAEAGLGCSGVETSPGLGILGRYLQSSSSSKL
ncbi:hypothetical protein GQ42DRAFT_164248 [Ramicandelaber brevisporus]|nr:hypothetical protein GQ42DRAFT_164248 [Ramicandelaber brevisporus]